MMRLTRFLETFLALALLAGAQTVPLTQSAMTNQDVVTLAKAGFNEGFIIETISMSLTQFDTSKNGVAELARQGLTERIIGAMIAASTPPPEAVPAPIPPPPAAPAPAPAAETAAPAAAAEAAGEPGGDSSDQSHIKVKTYVVKPSAVRQAISTQTAYRESTSVFWGLWKKQVAVGAVPNTEQDVARSLGGLFNQARRPAASPSPAPPQPSNGYYQVPVRYVVLQ